MRRIFPLLLILLLLCGCGGNRDAAAPEDANATLGLSSPTK